MPPPGHRFEAEYRSGSQPGADRVAVRFDTRGLVIEGSEGRSVTWTYDSLGADTPTDKGSHRIVVTSAVEHGATLTVDSDTFLPSLLQSAPQLSKRRRMGPDWAPMAWAALALVGLIGGLLWALYALFPYKTVARRIPDDTRQKIGQYALAELTKGYKRCETPAGNAALNKLVERLAQASGTDTTFKVQVVDWSLVNAFAVMGNQIVLTRGLLRTASSPDEVAGVLGHEMGHAIEVHPEETVLRALGTYIGAQVLLGGWSPDLVTQAGTQLLLMRHSRRNETAADEVALRLLKSAKISASPFAGFFDKISRESEQKKSAEKGYKLPDVFQTHPPPPERAERARSQPTYTSTPALEAAEWTALQGICG